MNAIILFLILLLPSLTDAAPENLVQDLVDFFRARGVHDISEFHVISEDVRFMLPKPIRDAVSGAPRPEGVAGAS